MTAYVISRDLYYSHTGVVVARIINTVIGIIQFFLVVALVLQLLGANPGAAFVAWIYSVASGLMGPFAGAFPSLPLLWGTLDLSLIFAMIGYSIIGWLLHKLLAF